MITTLPAWSPMIKPRWWLASWSAPDSWSLITGVRRGAARKWMAPHLTGQLSVVWVWFVHGKCGNQRFNLQRGTSDQQIWPPAKASAARWIGQASRRQATRCGRDATRCGSAARWLRPDWIRRGKGRGNSSEEPGITALFIICGCAIRANGLD